jgi:hypothetical protein
MSRLEQRNLVILVAVIVGLLVGVGVLANYSGILQARSQKQAQTKVSCSKDATACALAHKETCGVSAAFASMETSEASGCCASDKNVGCEHNHASCSEKETSCEKAAECDKAKSSGCCGEPKAEGCCAAQKESTT